MHDSMTIMVPPPQSIVLPDGRTFLNDLRQNKKVDEISQQLSELTGRPVPVLVETLASAPASGFLLLFDGQELPSYPDLGPRTVLLYADRHALGSPFPEERIQDRYALAGAIEEDRLFHGLIPVAERAGLEIIGGNRLSAYRALRGPTPCSRAELIVRYLTAYEEMGLHLRGRGA